MQFVYETKRTKVAIQNTRKSGSVKKSAKVFGLGGIVHGELVSSMKSITPLSFCKFSDLVGAFLGHWLQSSRRAEFCLHEVPMKRTVTVFLREYATRQAITMLWLALILVTTLLVLRLAKLLRLWMKGNRLPGPPLGLLSATSKVGDLSNFSIYLGALHKQYGPIVRIWLGPMHLLVSINDHEIMESMMVLSKDRVPATRKALDLAFGKDSIFISTYKKARRTRFSLHRALNGNVIEKVHSISIQICNQLDRWTTPGLSGMEFEIEVFSQHIVFAVLGAILFGDNFLVWPSSKEFEKLLFGISEKACYWARYPLSPFWTNGFKQYKEMCLRAQGLVEELLTFSNYLKDDASSSMPKQKYKQFYEGILFFSKGLETSCAQEVLEGDVQDIRENLFGMMYHGCHTMATTLGCVIARLAQNPEIQAKVHSEVDLVCEERSPPSAADIKKMHYLLAVVYECARLLPDRHLLQRCAIDHDLKVAPDTVIPAGAIIALPVKVMGMDAEIWGHDVHEFNPDRFLKYASTLGGRTTCMLTTPLCNPLKNSTDGTDICNTLGNSTDEPCVSWRMESKQSSSNKKLSLTTDPSFLLFGGGSRACIGRTFAMTEILTLLAFLFQQYKVEVCLEEVHKAKDCNINLSSQLCMNPKYILVPRQQ